MSSESSYAINGAYGTNFHSHLQEEYRCHSCYAFAAVGAVESAHAIRTGERKCLSEQQVLDCSSKAACTLPH